ncbi:MAG: hypothetical protein L0332_09370 [Chloroflexi bacterium]|nr:hypothetical protein [Chloroflexota bacterium]MCI0646210.1 hypothetical protein [Chloroflexota bacterium]MCI0726915.1 hypothetical protein [Chloroflexota bacterium]
MSEETVFKAQVGRLGEKVSLPAVLLIGGGLVLLAVNLFHIDLMGFFWPVMIGLLLLWPAYGSTAEKQSSLSFLAAPGAALAALGSLLFMLDLAGHSEAMAYGWTLVLAAGAAGLMYARRFDRSNRIHASGHRFIRWMLLAFMGLAVVFELLIFQSLGPWWPVVLVGLGVYLLVKNKK